MRTIGKTNLLSLAVFLASVPAANFASAQGVLEEVIVTAQKREQGLQDVPISVAALSGERYDSIFSGGADILALSAQVPGLYAESSNGRASPRFYIRGLGNVDFDLAASQPVSIIMDDVVMENVTLKSFPLFDIERVEVIRGPQGTLFGRNTTAGIVKFDSRKPTEELEGFAKVTAGNLGQLNVEAAIGGPIVDGKLAGRLAILSQNRDDWIDNGFTGESDAMGSFEEQAYRAQLLWTPTENFSALLSYQDRDLDGTASIFYANALTTGSNRLNGNFDRDKVYYDDGDNNPQGVETDGVTLKMDWDIGNMTLSSITASMDSESFSRGDIDGGVVDFSQSVEVPPGITFDPNANVFGSPALTFPGTITVPSLTQDSSEVKQFTQELRLTSHNDGAMNWQVGLFYFDGDLDVITDSFASIGFDPNMSQNTIVFQDNQTTAVFGQLMYDVTDQLNLTGGIRYTEDEKSFEVKQYGQLWLDLGIPPVPSFKVDDDQVSWELSANYNLTDDSSTYVRVADGFRGQSIQGRDVAFLLFPTVAESETILSFEVGYKADLLDNSMRINGAVFYYEIDDMQLSAVGGMANSNQLLNADKGEGYGFEVDLEWAATELLMLTGGFSYNHTEIQDSGLTTAGCGSGLCTPTDPVAANGLLLIDGNSFQSAPETLFNFTARYTIALDHGELYLYTDWTYQGETQMALYEAVEFETDSQFEGGVRMAYINDAQGWELGVFGRNITDEENVKGFIDFSNNTAIVNEPALWGVDFAINF